MKIQHNLEGHSLVNHQTNYLARKKLFLMQQMTAVLGIFFLLQHHSKMLNSKMLNCSLVYSTLSSFSCCIEWLSRRVLVCLLSDTKPQLKAASDDSASMLTSEMDVASNLSQSLGAGIALYPSSQENEYYHFLCIPISC